MRLTELAEQYVKDNGLRSRVIVLNCSRFERLTGLHQVEKISTEVLNAFRQASRAMALSNVTTEKTVTDVLTIVKATLKDSPDAGKRLKQPRPEPKPATLVEIDAIFHAAKSQRLKRWLALTYWTGLRISDSILLYSTLRQPVPVIHLTASKTGLHHSWPVPTWLHQWMSQVEPVTGYCTEWFGRLIRDELAIACHDANIKVKTPKNIRQASITEWTRANATAGAIVHGCGLGVMACYLDPLSVLESAAPRVRVPTCFGLEQSASNEEALLSHFRRLDPAAQGLVTGMSERLAAG